jgi:hypothetical protein
VFCFWFCFASADQANEHAGIMYGIPCWALAAHQYGLSSSRDTIRALQAEAGLTYQTAQKTLDGCLTPWVRKRGDSTMNVYFVTAESWTWFNQMAHILLSINSPGVSREEVLANLPSVDIVIQQAMTHDEYSQTQALLGILMSLFLAVAAVCEKYQEYERALPYLDAALSTDLTRAGNHLPISRVQHSLLKGRVLAALGRKAEAAETLEGTAEEAHRYGIRMCEVFALRDLKLGVLDDLGHGEHASRRLGAVLRLLKGPAEKLTELLKGLDAGALMALPPPDPSYRVVYEVDSSDTALRRELEGLKLKELRKRARDADVDSSQLEDAADDDDPKSAVIELLLISLKSTAVDQDGEAALQTELEGLRLKELRGRAKAAGIDSSLLEDAADDDDPKSAVIQLIIGLHKNAGSLSPLAEGEAGIIDHLSNGNASQREQAYAELELAIANRNVQLLCSCIPSLWQVLCFDAEKVDAAECRRVTLLLGDIVSVDQRQCGGCCWKDERCTSPFKHPRSVLALVRVKSAAELSSEDALTLGCYASYWRGVSVMGNTATADAAGLSEMEMMIVLGSIFPCYPDEARTLKLVELTMDLLRRKQLPDAATVGCWTILAYGGLSVPAVGKRLFDLGIFELCMTELRSASPMDWARIQDRDDGRFGMAMHALQQVGLPSPLLTVGDLTAKATETGAFQASLSVIKSAEIIADSKLLQRCSVHIGGLCFLLNMDSADAKVRQSIREAASSLRFLLELTPPLDWCRDFAITSVTHATILAAVYFGRDEDGGPFAFSQDDLDQVLSCTTEMFTCQAWAIFFPLLQNWSSIPDLSLCASDKNKTL